MPWHEPTKKKEVGKNPSTKVTWWCFSWSPNSTRRAYGVFSLEHVLELNPLATWFGNPVSTSAIRRGFIPELAAHDAAHPPHYMGTICMPARFVLTTRSTRACTASFNRLP